MTIRLDHTIVPANDKIASAEFFAQIFGLTVKKGGHFAQVQINESLTFDFADERGREASRTLTLQRFRSITTRSMSATTSSMRSSTA